MAQSCLEVRSMEERHEEMVRSDYNRDNQYNVTHPDALSTGDKHGKGVGGSHSHWLPNCSGSIGMINYSNFNTSYTSEAGNIDDNNARNTALARSLYSPVNEYGKIDTQMNLREGQYRVP